jgi:hypothetical protein
MLDPDPRQSKELDPDPYYSKNMVRIRIKVKIQELYCGSNWSCGGPWAFTMEAWRLKMETWRVSRPVVVDLHHFDEEEQYPYRH